MLEELIKMIPCINDHVEEIVKGVKIDQQNVVPCLKAYVFNSFILYVASHIRRNKNVNIRKYSSRIKRSLSNSSKVKYLINICKLYLKLISKGRNIMVDIGCGLGLNLNISRSYRASSFMLGIDRDIFFLKILKKLLDEVEVIQGDALMLPIRSHSVDVVFSTNLVHELPCLDIISEFERVLKKCGYLLLIDIVFRFIPSQILNIIRDIKVKIGLEPETPYTLKQIVAKIKSHNMIIEESLNFWKLIIGTTIIFAKKK